MEMLVTKFSNGKYRNEGELFSEPISAENVKLMGKMIALQALRTVKKFDIPDGVTTIADYVFNGCLSLTNVSLPDGLTQIGAYAFGACKSLTDITLPASLIKIGIYGFSGCTSLTSIEVPDTVTEIGEAAFNRCEALTSAVLPNRLQMLAEDLFAWCSKLTSITIPDSVTTIGSYAFGKCTSLASITIPENVTAIGANAFYGCSLTSVTFEDESSEWNISDGSVFVPDNDDFDNKNGEALKTTYVAYTWTKIEQHVHTAGEEWVSDSTKHWQICTGCGARMNEEKHAPTADGYSLGTDGHWFDCKCGERVLGEHNFHDGISQNCTICGMTDPKCFNILPADSSDGCALHLNRTYAEIITGTLVFPEYDGNGRGEDDPITEIGPNFFQMENVTSIVLPDTLKVIDEYAFMRNPITSITIPAGVTSIGNEAFTHCEALTSVIFEDTSSEWSISNGSTFVPSSDPTENATALTETYCDYTWTKGGTHTHVAGEWITDTSNHWHECTCGAEFDKEPHNFVDENCSVCGVTDTSSILFGETSDGGCIISGASGIPSLMITDLTIPDEVDGKPVTGIADSAFYGLTNLKTVTLPDTITTIGNNAFADCTSLESINIPSSVTSIGEKAFSGCWALPSITIPDSVTSIGESAFYDCLKLASVTLPENSQFTTISVTLFEQCEALTSITIPASVTSIGEYAFAYCESLKTITITVGSQLATINSGAFENSGLESITIPASVTFIVGHAFGNCSSLTCVIFEDESSEWNISDDSVFLPSSDPAENATALTTTYCDYFWTKVTD